MTNLEAALCNKCALSAFKAKDAVAGIQVSRPSVGGLDRHHQQAHRSEDTACQQRRQGACRSGTVCCLPPGCPSLSDVTFHAHVRQLTSCAQCMPTSPSLCDLAALASHSSATSLNPVTPPTMLSSKAWQLLTHDRQTTSGLQRLWHTPAGLSCLRFHLKVLGYT